MDYGNPLANRLSEQPHVSGIIQGGSQSLRMGFEAMDARAKHKLLQTLVGHVMI